MSTRSVVGGDDRLDNKLKDSFATWRTDHGVEVRATLLRVARHVAVLEVPAPAPTLRVSEAFVDFKIVTRDLPVYFGRAVVQNLIHMGVTLVCEAALDDSGWKDVDTTAAGLGKEELYHEFKTFVHEWQKLYRVTKEYKIAVADLQSFLSDLRLWLDQVEAGLAASPPAEQQQFKEELAAGLWENIKPAAMHLFERFEEISRNLEPELQPAHRAFGRRQLHPLVLCSPFIHRCYSKPLGYAGDYEMMNMILRHGAEGHTLFAKVVQSYILDQAPAHAVRNRVGYLADRIVEETARVSRNGKVASIYDIACGPAREVENFLEHPLADSAQFRLLDFNEETLNFTKSRISSALRRHNRRTRVEFVKNSVHTLLKSQNGATSREARYDLIYSSGLYDYLNDRVCKALNTYLYDRLSPGGLLVVGNFGTNNPIQQVMEHALEWFLIYRDRAQLAATAPEQAPPENCVVRAEPTSTNIFLEVRKPK